MLEQYLHILPNSGKRLASYPISPITRQRSALRGQAKNRLLPALLQRLQLLLFRQLSFKPYAEK